MDLQSQDYDPNGFIDWLVKDVYKVKNDAALSRAIGCAPPVISKIRHRVLPMPLGMLVVVHEFSGIKTLDIKARMYRSAVAYSEAPELKKAA